MRQWINLFESQSPAEAFAARFSEANLPLGIHVDLDAYDTHGVFISWIERNDDAPAGAGKALLVAMCELADQLGVSLSLRVAPEYDDETEAETQNEKLVDLYQSVGFVPTNVEPGQFGGTHMERAPNSPQQT